MVLGGAYSSNANEKMMDCCITVTATATDMYENSASATVTSCNSSCALAEMNARHQAQFLADVRLMNMQ